MLVLELYYRKISQEVTVMYIQDLWMALVTRYGMLDFFVTVTCNPYWDEIVQQLLPGQMPQDRSDIVARVYRAKL